MDENKIIENTENINEKEELKQSIAEYETAANTAEQVNETADNATEEIKETAENTADKDKKEGEEEKSSFFSDVLEITESVFMSIFVVLLLFTFVARPVTVDGRSMYPTLEDKDKLIMNSLFCSPDVGDIVIVDNQNGYTLDADGETVLKNAGLEKRIIKRVIATEGQTVDIDFVEHTVKVDGELRDEPFIADATSYNPGGFEYPITIPKGYVFVMGDNRNNSTDSRDSHVGLVKKDDIMGEAVFRFYPISKFGFI